MRDESTLSFAYHLSQFPTSRYTCVSLTQHVLYNEGHQEPEGWKQRGVLKIHKAQGAGQINSLKEEKRIGTVPRMNISTRGSELDVRLGNGDARRLRGRVGQWVGSNTRRLFLCLRLTTASSFQRTKKPELANLLKHPISGVASHKQTNTIETSAISQASTHLHSFLPLPLLQLPLLPLPITRIPPLLLPLLPLLFLLPLFRPSLPLPLLLPLSILPTPESNVRANRSRTIWPQRPLVPDHLANLLVQLLVRAGDEGGGRRARTGGGRLCGRGGCTCARRRRCCWEGPKWRGERLVGCTRR